MPLTRSGKLAVSDHGPDEYDWQTFCGATLPIRPIVPDILSTFSTYEKGNKNLNPDQQFVLGQFIGKETDAAFSYNGFVKEIAWGYGLKKLVMSCSATRWRRSRRRWTRTAPRIWAT